MVEATDQYTVHFRPIAFVSRIVMSAVCVGACEHMRGTWFTAALFLTVHMATLALLALLLFSTHWLFISHTAQLMLDISDVGPSAAITDAWDTS